MHLIFIPDMKSTNNVCRSLYIYICVEVCICAGPSQCDLHPFFWLPWQQECFSHTWSVCIFISVFGCKYPLNISHVLVLGADLCLWCGH